MQNPVTALTALLLCVGSTACATAKRQSDIPLDRSGQNAEYGVRMNTDGFEIEISYSRYQFIPESDAVAAACRSQLLATAYEYADSQGRTLEPLNEQRVRISMGRNGITGITTCRAHGVAKWK